MKKTETVSLKGSWLANFSPAEIKIKKMSSAVILPAIALTSALLVALTIAVFMTSQAAAAQGVSTSPTATQEPAAQPSSQSNNQSNNQNMQPVAVEQTFSGKIVKAGSHFVLLDAANSTTFELDDQQKAHQFLNKNVKVKGVLDATTGTIQMSAIDPA